MIDMKKAQMMGGDPADRKEASYWPEHQDAPEDIFLERLAELARATGETVPALVGKVAAQAFLETCGQTDNDGVRNAQREAIVQFLQQAREASACPDLQYFVACWMAAFEMEDRDEDRTQTRARCDPPRRAGGGRRRSGPTRRRTRFRRQTSTRRRRRRPIPEATARPRAGKSPLLERTPPARTRVMHRRSPRVTRTRARSRTRRNPSQRLRSRAPGLLVPLAEFFFSRSSRSRTRVRARPGGTR